MSDGARLTALCNELQQLVDAGKSASTDANINVARISYLLVTLESYPMTLSLLQHSKAGVLLNSIRKHLNDRQSSQCKLIIKQWKEIALSGAGKSKPVSVSDEMRSPEQYATSSSLRSTVTKPTPVTSPRTLDSEHCARSTSLSVTATSALNASVSRRKRARGEDVEREPGAVAPAASSSPSPPPSASPLYTLQDLPQPNGLDYHQHLSPSRSHSIIATPSQQYYNPNLAQYNRAGQRPADDSDNEDAEVGDDDDDDDDTGSATIDHTSRKRARRTIDLDFIDDSAHTSGTCPIRLCTLSQMVIDFLSQNLSAITKINLLPSSLLVTVLSKSTVEQLMRIEVNNPQLSASDTDSLWKQHCYKKLSLSLAELESDFATRRCEHWRDYYHQRQSEHQSKLSLLGNRLKTRLANERKERAETSGIKLMDARQATKQLEKSKKFNTIKGVNKSESVRSALAASLHPSSAGGSSHRHSSHSKDAAARKLKDLRKASRGVSKKMWQSRRT